MHKFIRKPDSSYQYVPSESSNLNGTDPRTNFQMIPILELQRTIGNRAVQRSLRLNAGGLEINSGTTTAIRLDRDECKEEDVFFGQTPKRVCVTYDEAIRIHETQQTQVLNVLTEGLLKAPDPAKSPLDPDNLFYNTAEWIETQATLLVLTPTHSWFNNSPENPVSYFDPNVKYPEIGGSYPRNNGRAEYPKPGLITMAPLGTHADTDTNVHPPVIRLYINAKSPIPPAELRQTLIHEVQHIADQHFGTWSSRLADIYVSSAWDRYKSEFRSFWLQPPKDTTDDFGPADSPAKNDRKVSWRQLPEKETNFKNGRQENIFWNIIREYGDFQFDRFYITNPDFKKLVDDFAAPVSGNLVNSIRIDALSQKMRQCNQAMDINSAPMQRVMEQAGRLDAIDRRFLNDKDLSKPFWDQARDRLAGNVFARLEQAVK